MPGATNFGVISRTKSFLPSSPLDARRNARSDIACLGVKAVIAVGRFGGNVD